MSERDFDVVVFGATGVTGRRVAGYLAARGAERWAAAGRSAAKVKELLAADGVSAPEVIVADIDQPDSLAQMASRTRVVLDLVGPYAKYGRPVISACVEGGAHYLDLSGEMPFLRRSIDEFDAPAKAAQVKVVQPCGFESLPPDLLVRAVAESAAEQLESVELEAHMKPPPGMPRPSDGVSGGTAQSMVAAIGDESPETVLDPAALIVDEQTAAEVRRRSPIPIAPRRGAGGSVIAPMIPVAYINPAVIHRSAHLAGPPGAKPFRYREGVALTGGPATLALRFALAGILSGVQAGMRAGLQSSPAARRRIERAMRAAFPGSGFGPRPDRLENWKWSMTVTARTASGRSVTGRVDGAGHPGYLTTAKMLGEAGLLLAEDGATPDEGGCLTPSAALGTATLERFERSGLSFSVGAGSREAVSA